MRDQIYQQPRPRFDHRRIPIRCVRQAGRTGLGIERERVQHESVLVADVDFVPEETPGFANFCFFSKAAVAKSEL